MEQERYILQQSSNIPNRWVITDTKYGVVVTFTQGHFNDTQKVTLLYDNTNLNIQDYARIMRELGDYMVNNHSNII